MTIQSSLTALADAVRSKAGVSGKLTIDGMTAAVNGITVGGGGMDFYECASVTNGDTPTWSGYKMEWREGSSSPAVSAIRISGTTNGVADGDYVSDPALTGADRKFINTSNANAFIEWNDGWSINLNGTARVVAVDGSVATDSSIDDICNETWRVKLAGSGIVGSTGDEINAEAVTIGGGGSPAGWYKTDTLTEGLEVKGYYPVVGKIYNQDTTIEVKKAFDGVLIPIPQNGLVFYAPLQTDYVDMVSGSSASVTGGSFTEHNGIRCLELDGSGYVKWANNSDLPVGTSACSLVLIASPINQSSWRYYMGIGQPGNSQHMSIATSGGRFMDKSTYLETGIWQTLIITRTSDGSFKDYVDGNLVGTSNRLDDFPTPSCMCVGAAMWDNFSQKANSYVAFAAVYNRELTADEVLEIHNALMEGVQQ